MMMTNTEQNGLLIRNARAEELDDISILIREAYREYQRHVPTPAWDYYVDDITDVRSRLGKSELIVAELLKHIVGTVTLYLRGNQDAGWPENWAVIRILAVDPAYRDRGIGRKLMEECIKRCRQVDISTIGLHTTKAMSIAQGMYECMGFKRVPELDFHPASGVEVLAYRFDL